MPQKRLHRNGPRLPPAAPALPALTRPSNSHHADPASKAPGAGRGAARCACASPPSPPPPRRQRCSVLTSDAQSPSNGRTSRGRQEPGSGGRIGASGAVSGAGAEGGSGSKVVPGGSGRLAVVRWTLGVARGTSALSACSDRAAAPRGRGDGGGQGYG